MEVKVQKWGDKLAICIPPSFAMITQLVDGSFVDLSISEGDLVASPLAQKNDSPKTSYDLHAEY